MKNEQIKLGTPIPDSKHAISVSLPEWADIIGYCERDDRVMQSLRTAYPRFVYHPITQKLLDKCKEDFAEEHESCLIFPSKDTALSCAEYIKIGTSIKKYGKQDAYMCIFPESKSDKANEFWQHTGCIISSRQAESLLNDEDTPPREDIKETLIKRIANLSDENTDNIYLFPSGMSAFYNALRIIGKNGKSTIQLGFPYVDSLKIQQKFGNALYISSSNNNYLDEIANAIDNGNISALFCEFPCNPLLNSIDIKKLSTLLKENNIPLIIDDTIATWENADLLPYADIIITSLTKFFSGASDVMAGSITLNSNSPFYENLKEKLDEIYEDLLFPEDAIVLEKNSRDFSDRMKTINNNAEKLCDFLSNHKAIENIYYPKYIDREIYDSLKKSTGGYGGLFSFTLKNPDSAPAIYDALAICKGPSLGTNFTLACPYTLLAHYNELSFAKENGVAKNLIRVSVGLEDIKGLINKFSKALEHFDKIDC